MNSNFKKIATAVSATAAAFAMSAAFSITAEALDAPVITGQTESSETSAQYQWNPVNGADGYLTRYSIDGVNWYNPEKSYLTYEFLYPLNAGTSYYVQVAATTDTEQGPWSAPFEVVTRPDDSNVSTNTTGAQTGATTTSATISWGEAAGSTGYHIYTESNGLFTLIGTANTTSFKATNLTADTAYRFYIAPYKQSASGFVAEYNSYPPSVTATTLAKKPSVKVDYGYGITSTGFELPATNADGYRVRFYNQKGKLITEKFNTAWSSFTSSVSPGSSVCNYGVYRKVKAASYLTLNNKKVYSGTTTKSYIFQPKVTVKRSSGKLSLSWKKVPKATKYEVYVSYSKNDGYKKVATLSSKKTSYTVKKFKGSKISKNKTYYVYVKPVAKGATSVCTTCWYVY